MSVGDLVQSATAILASAQRRAEDAAHNITNIATPGYRSKHGFSEVLASIEGERSDSPTSGVLISLTPGQLSETGVATDLAITGDGFFELRDETGPLYTRNGQLARGDEGRLLGVGGRAVQGVGGGDIVLPDGPFSVEADGAVRTGDSVVARIAVFDFDPAVLRSGPDGLLTAPADSASALDGPVVRQGFLESSNVSLGDEMVALMEAIRRAETGQRLMNVYDDLMGRAITTLGQTSG